MSTVERVYSLHESSKATGLENDKPDDGDKVSEPEVTGEQTATNYRHPEPFSLEDERRQARENWLRLRRQKIEGATAVDHDHLTDRNAKEDQGHSPDNDLDE